MHLLPPDEIRARLEGLVHFDTQASAPSGLDLTAAALFALTEPGQLDFGGSEAKTAERQRLDPQRANPDDDYGWWKLEAGPYVVRYNESIELKGKQIALLAPHERLLAAGAHHPTVALRAPQETSDPIEVLLAVNGPGLRIKENARVSTLLLFDDGA